MSQGENTAPTRKAQRSVKTREELEALLVEGLQSGDARALTEDDWESLRQRAQPGSKVRKSG